NKKIDSMSSVNKKKTPYTLIKPGTLNSHNLRKAPKTSLDSESSDKAPPKMYYALQNARRKGAIFNISKPKEISSVLYAIGSRYELKSESFSDIEEPKHWSPEDIVMCKCMDLTDLMMQQSISLKYTRSNKVKDSLVDDLEAKEVTLDKSIEHHSHVLVEAIKLHKSDIQGSMPAMNKDSFKVLLDIKESYENGTDLMLNKSCEYEREFIKNLNIVLYMISKEDLNNIDNEFMKKIHSHFSTHLSRNKFSFSSGNISFVKIDEETTEADVGEKFIKSFEEITREEE
ncbi:MAG: hypothetical protein KAH32_09205, partial [Chlamydiia bacterium]|nr:hypothetical protein [Chlamydiia bacterium]